MNSSAQNLMGLLNQWQNIDATLTNYLVEIVLKLSSFTEAGVFILVETAEGRRFAGKDHLCTAYNQGLLRNGGQDVELEADLQTAILRPKPLPPPPYQSPMPLMASSSSSPFSSLVPSQSPHGLPPSSSKASTVTVGRKRPSHTKDTGPPTKRLDDTEDEDDIVISDDDDDWVNEMKFDIKTEGDGRVGPSGPGPSSSFEFSQDSNSMQMTPFQCDVPLPSLNQQYDLSWIGSEFIPSNRKASVIVDLDAETADFSENSVTKKILDSVLYDVGKAALAKCPFADAKDSPLLKTHYRTYVDAVFAEWCRHIKHLDALEKFEINYTPERKMAFKVFMRAKISTAISQNKNVKRKQSLKKLNISSE